MKKTIAILSLLGLAACGGGGGGGTVSSVTPTIDTTPTPIMGDGTTINDIQADYDQSPIAGVGSNLIRDISNAHADGYTGVGFNVFTVAPEEANVIAPGSSHFDIEDLAGVVSQNVADIVNPNDEFNGGVLVKQSDNDYVIFNRSVTYTDENGNQGYENVGSIEAAAGALVWDKFDNISGSTLESHIDSTRDTVSGNLNLARALSPTELQD